MDVYWLLPSLLCNLSFQKLILFFIFTFNTRSQTLREFSVIFCVHKVIFGLYLWPSYSSRLLCALTPPF